MLFGVKTPLMAEDDKCSGNDTLTLGPDLGDGARPFIRHRSDHSMETGIARPPRDGESINSSDVVHLHHRGPGPVYDVEVLYEHAARAAEEEGSGPAMVNSEAYRTGWDQIFGSRTVGQA